MSDKTKKILKIVSVIVITVIFIIVTVLLTPKLVKMWKDKLFREEVRDKLQSLGWPGVAVMFGLQVLQVVVAFLPGEPVEMFMGYLYGAVGGLILCLAGVAVGTILIFMGTKFFGRKFINKISLENKKKYAFLRDPIKRDAMFFLLYLIPGTPKDALTFFAPVTRIGLWRFIIISGVARIPSIISSTYVGKAAGEGRFGVAIIVFAITAVVGLAGIYINDKILAAQHDKTGAAEKEK